MTTTALDLDHVHIFLRGTNWVSDGVTRERGEVLDTSAWRATRITSLIENRTIGRVPYSLPETIETCSCGRMWLDAEAAARHTCPVTEESD
jgi:hypothetical protein